MHHLLAVPFTLMAGTSSASVMQSFVTPVLRTMCIIAAPIAAFFIVNGAVAYMTSAGNPEKLAHAKRTILRAIGGLVVVIAAATVTTILTHAFHDSGASTSSVTNLTAITPAPVSNGVVGFIIKMITGVLNDIIQSLASPFIKSLAYFTKSTPNMTANATVYHMWGTMVAISDTLFALVVALLGFHVMSASTFGFEEVEFKTLLPRFGLIFLALNTSVYSIDWIIDLSNVLIHAVTLTNGTTSLWDALTDVVKQSAALGLPSLLIMLLFTIFSVILVIYYLGRLITLYIGTVLSPLVLLLWLVPGFRDFSETAAKAYLMTIFVLFVQVVILILAGSLIAGVVVGSPTQTTGTLMPMVAGVTAMYALLKTPGVMAHFALASVGPRSARQLGGQFINGVSFLSGRGGNAKQDVDLETGRRLVPGTGSRKSVFGQVGSSTVAHTAVRTRQEPQVTTTSAQSSQSRPKPKTGTTTVAPKQSSATKVTKSAKTMEKP